MRVARLKYAHSDPLFKYSGLNPVPTSNNESIKLILEEEVDVAFVPLTYAAHHCDVINMVPYFAVYSKGPVLSARLFRGSGRGYAAIEDTSVNAGALSALMGVSFERVSDPYDALRRYEGVLVIGDEALRMTASGLPYIVDVGELWEERIGKPLVYAVMVARISVDNDELMRVINGIRRSLNSFMVNPEPLIREVAGRLNVPEWVVRDYLVKSIRYEVNDEVIDGINTELEILKLPKCIRVLPRQC
ncbi:MqnA/MqnD/SBP family protein [Caldivirga sp.]|uniref:MqnA/MqnD/SBP family protein n=1 Tax=Caldivirga sp. TaxID=2080243 RepID=UPI003D0E60F9